MKPYILHIDDSHADMILVRGILSDHYSVTSKRSPDKNDTTRYDCIVCDLNLDHSFGYETLSLVKTCYPDTPIIILTGTAGVHLTGDIIRHMMQSGAANIASKDILCDDTLVSLIARTIDFEL